MICACYTCAGNRSVARFNASGRTSCVFALFMCVLLVSAILPPLHAQTNAKPNVLLIYTDDQGTLDMGAYGASDLITPHMDQLAKTGVRFTQFYAAAPVCSPSRAALMTGRYPQRAGLATNASSDRGGKSEMPGTQVTMGEMFRDAGYATGHIGKWHMGYSTPTMPNQQGFEYSFGHMGGCIDNYSHYFYWQGPNRHDLWRNGEEVWEDGRFFPDLMVDEIARFLEANRSGPFFLYWALNIPHYPLQGQEVWRERYRHLPSPRREYAALVSTMDEKIGAVMSQLKALNLDKNTIVVFQSDHGHSEEERAFGGGGYAGSYRGAKFSLLEGGIRVPAIISWPGTLPENEVRTQMAVNVDWMPTLAALCGIPLPQRSLDGKSLVPVLHSAKAPSPHQSFFWESGGGDKPQWAVRAGDWKLISNPVGNHFDESEKDPAGLYLFDVARDPGEARNLAAREKQRVEKMKDMYHEWRRTAEQQ